MHNLQNLAEGPQANPFLRIPAELRALPQWCVTQGTATNKAPYGANGKHASTTDPSTWMDFGTACRLAADRGGLIGFMLSSSDQFACIDLDVKDDTRQDRLDLYQRIENELNSYTEWSRSGRGKHIWVKGKIGKGVKRDGVEVYSQERFIICTGNVVRDRPIFEAQTLLTNMVMQMRPVSFSGTCPLEEMPEDADDWYILTVAHHAANSEKFDALWRGEWAKLGYPSQSEADMALLSMLTFYSPSNAQCRRLFRESGLGAREKATKNDAYLDRILLKIRGRGQSSLDGSEPAATAASGTSAPDSVALRRPRDVLRELNPPPFEFDEVPPSIAEFARAQSAATGHDQSGVIVSALTAAAAVIDDNYKLTVRHQSNWSVSARQWSFLCGGPSAGKSPSIRAATERIKAMHNERFDRWVDACDSLDKGEPRPPVPALYTSDTTVAALADALIANERGLLMLTEEMSSWIGAIDSSNRGDAAKNRGDWLQLRDGGSRQINRVERGAMLVKNWGVSVLAACTPRGLAEHMKSMPEDGLIQRFVPCILAAPTLDATIGDARQASKVWGEWLKWAWEHTTSPFPRFLTLDSKARELFDSEELEIRKLGFATQDFSPAYAAHLGKHPGMLAEVALVFHVFLGQQGNEVGAEAMQYAIRYMRKVRRHAYVLYSSILSSAPAFELAQAVARSIVAAESELTTVGRDWMTQHCQAFKKADDRLRREAVQILEDADWLEAQAQARSYGGWPSKYKVSQEVFNLYAREGEQWRARRAAVRDAIGEAE